MNRNVSVVCVVDMCFKNLCSQQVNETIISVFDLKISRHPHPSFDIKEHLVFDVRILVI